MPETPYSEEGYDEDNESHLSLTSVTLPIPTPLPSMPTEIELALGQARFIYGMMDHNRAAKALDLPVDLYNALTSDKSRVQRRVVSMAAERLGLGVSAGMPNRLKIPFPKAGAQVMLAARVLGLIAGLYTHGGMMVRTEMMQLSETFGEEHMRFASKNRRIAESLPPPQFQWPPHLDDAGQYGANLLVSWAQDAAPALANLLKIAMPPRFGNHPIPLPANIAALDNLILQVLSHYWAE
jgi:hypothetical protein